MDSAADHSSRPNMVVELSPEWSNRAVKVSRGHLNRMMALVDVDIVILSENGPEGDEDAELVFAFAPPRWRKSVEEARARGFVGVEEPSEAEAPPAVRPKVEFSFPTEPVRATAEQLVPLLDEKPRHPFPPFTLEALTAFMEGRLSPVGTPGLFFSALRLLVARADADGEPPRKRLRETGLHSSPAPGDGQQALATTTSYDALRNRLTYASKEYRGLLGTNPELIAAQWPAPSLFTPSGGVVELVDQVRRFLGQIDLYAYFNKAVVATARVD